MISGQFRTLVMFFVFVFVIVYILVCVFVDFVLSYIFTLFGFLYHMKSSNLLFAVSNSERREGGGPH